MTLIDTNNHTKLGDIMNVASAPTGGSKSQSHTSSVDPQNAGMFYTAASQDGNLVEIDAISGVVTRTLSLDTDGYIIQGTYDWCLGQDVCAAGGDM